ncbi:hypothetical protein AArcCO_2741 [Halalkaliarchaeum sp. AArc-CO]|nr:hypothetical protein AArcCO_2741 [Halalkaliarchaeum sp. AArc-CO]
MEQIGDDLESPESLESRASVRSSLTSFAAVLPSAVFLQRLAPFSPGRTGCWAALVGM